MEERIKCRKRKPDPRANFPQIVFAKDWLRLALRGAPSFPGIPFPASPASPPPASDQDAASQWAVFNPC